MRRYVYMNLPGWNEIRGQHAKIVSRGVFFLCYIYDMIMILIAGDPKINPQFVDFTSMT